MHGEFPVMLTKEKAQALLAFIDLAVKSAGLQVAANAAILAADISAALQTAATTEAKVPAPVANAGGTLPLTRIDNTQVASPNPPH